MTYIEDILHILVDSIGISGADAPILASISRQCKKGIAMTDRQYQLVTNKLNNHKDLLARHNVEFNNNAPRLPLREIDRSKYISLVKTEDVYPNTPYEMYKQNYNWIKVRFPFSKQDIHKIEQVVHNVSSRNRRKDYVHSKGSHEHFFLYNSYTVYILVKEFYNRNFVIDKNLVDVFQQVQIILDNKSNIIPCFADNQFKNVHESAMELIDNEIDKENTILLKDRGFRYGYFVPEYKNNNTLNDLIVSRESREVLVDPKKYNINELVRAIYELNRFPLLVTVDQENCFNQLLEMHKAFKYIIEDTQQSVLFRVDNDDKENSDLNDYIKHNNLNNWVDKNTKIVYIKKNKLPKALLTSDFKPVAALGKTTMRNNAQVDVYINFNCDLILYHDNQENLFGKYSKKYGLLQTYY